MGKKSTKGIVIAVVALIVIGFVMQMTGILGSLESMVTPKPCDEAPYAGNCICASDEDRFAFGWSGLTRYICEPDIKLLDPDTPTFEADAIAHAQSYLNENYADCDMISCDIEGTRIVSVLGQGKDERVALVECVDDVLDKTYWRVYVDIYEGNLADAGMFEDSAYCVSYVAPVVGGTEPAELSQGSLDLHHTGDFYKMDLIFDAKCGLVDNGIASTTVYAPVDTPVRDWVMSDGGWYMSTDASDNAVIVTGVDSVLGGRCVLEAETADSVNLVCDSGCPATTGGGLKVFLFGLID